MKMLSSMHSTNWRVNRPPNPLAYLVRPTDGDGTAVVPIQAGSSSTLGRALVLRLVTIDSAVDICLASCDLVLFDFRVKVELDTGLVLLIPVTPLPRATARTVPRWAESSTFVVVVDMADTHSWPDATATL